MYFFSFRTYFITASKTVRPGQVYSVYVTVFKFISPITVRASIQRDGVELASATQECRSSVPETLLLKVRFNLFYYLKKLFKFYLALKSFIN